ncbi:MAG: hypothetical protein KDC33_03535 [Thermoleophilia bacterium]|nr:hypothetical protein [Thermoleophilia bacterium]
MPRPLCQPPRVALRPARLHAAVARGDGPSSEVVWDGSSLVYRAWRADRPGPPLPAVVHPTDADWDDFWADLDAAGAWKWRGRYDAPHHRPDAPGWLIRVHLGARLLDASGLAAFPDGAGGIPGPGFRRVCQALARLAGGRALG